MEYHDMRMILLMTGVIISAPAQPATSLERQLGKCMTMERDSARLACFERLAAAVAPEQVIAPAVPAETGHEGTARGIETAEPERMSDNSHGQSNGKDEARADAADREFGLEHREAEKDETITATVTAIDQDAYGRSLFTLSNGQIWHQTDTRRVTVLTGQAVSVTRGIFNSFFLRGESRRTTIKVRRKR